MAAQSRKSPFGAFIAPRIARSMNEKLFGSFQPANRPMSTGLRPDSAMTRSV